MHFSIEINSVRIINANMIKVDNTEELNLYTLISVCKMYIMTFVLLNSIT